LNFAVRSTLFAKRFSQYGHLSEFEKRLVILVGWGYNISSYFSGGYALRRLFAGAFLIILTLGLAGFARADIYKFVDENGVLHFTNVPNDSSYVWAMRESRPEGTVVSSEILQVRYDSIISTVSKRHAMDPSLVKAVIEAESDFDSQAKSKAGAVGLMQLMPETARGLGVTNLYDPTENIEGGVKHLKRLMVQFKRNVPLALAAYNAGATNVMKYGAIPPFKETMGFVERVLEYQKKYAGTFSR
jgi:soluble lytic murein transglycosylase-like protein